MIEVFSWAEFEDAWNRSPNWPDLRTYVNGRLSRLLGPRVYGAQDNFLAYPWTIGQHKHDTHQAYLFDVQELAPKKCEHEPDYVTIQRAHLARADVYDLLSESKCAKCGVKLRAEWRVRE